VTELFAGGIISNILLIGIFIGMRHALEADHVAAVASLARKNQSLSYTLKQGAVWGIGHTITLLLFGSIVIFMDTIMPEYLAVRLEVAVGVMLILLGGSVLRQVYKKKIHFHSHQHKNGDFHFHAHSHAGEPMSQHDPLAHDHQHNKRFPFRALLIGLMHGMAGSAAVILLTVDMGTTPLQGIMYILLFGIGSIVGMALLSIAISLPIRLFSKQLTLAHNLFQVLVGVLTVSLGVMIVFQNSAVLFH